MHIPSGLQGQGVHKWNLPSPYSVGSVFGSCILPSCFTNNTWYFQTLLLTQFDGYVVVFVFRSLYHETYLMPMSVESSNPLKYFQGAYLKTTERMQKKLSLISLLLFLSYFCLQFPLFHSFNYLYFPLFLLRSFSTIHSLSPLSCHSGIISDHNRGYQPPLGG